MPPILSSDDLDVETETIETNLARLSIELEKIGAKCKALEKENLEKERERREWAARAESAQREVYELRAAREQDAVRLRSALAEFKAERAITAAANNAPGVLQERIAAERPDAEVRALMDAVRSDHETAARNKRHLAKIVQTIETNLARLSIELEKIGAKCKALEKENLEKERERCEVSELRAAREQDAVRLRSALAELKAECAITAAANNALGALQERIAAERADAEVRALMDAVRADHETVAHLAKIVQTIETNLARLTIELEKIGAKCKALEKENLEKERGAERPADPAAAAAEDEDDGDARPRF